MRVEHVANVNGNAPWPSARLDDLASLRTDKIVPAPSDGRPYVGLEHIAQGRPKLLGIGRARDVISHKTVFEAGDILFGKLRPALRKVVRVDFSGVCSTDILAIYPKLADDGPYLQHLLHSDAVLVRALQSAEGTKMPRTSWDDLRGFRFACPPPDERRLVGAVLSSIDVAIEKTEAVAAATQKLRKTLLHELLTRGVPGSHRGWQQVPRLGVVPACWRSVSLGECGTWLSGGTPSKSRPDYWMGTIPWISPKDMKSRVLVEAADHISENGAGTGSPLVPPGTLLMVVRGMILAHSAPVAIVGARSSFNQDIKALRCHDFVTPEFLLNVLEYRESELVQLATPSTHGTMRIITDDLFGVRVPIPSVREQIAITRLVETLRARLDQEVRLVTQFRLLKTACTEELLSGRVRIMSSSSDQQACSDLPRGSR